MPKLIADVHAALGGLGSEALAAENPAAPAVPIRSSVGKEHISCLECGLKFKSIKRHLSTKHDLSPSEYRAKWGLPTTYPLVAPGYAEVRSKLARQSGLGRKGAGRGKPSGK